MNVLYTLDCGWRRCCSLSMRGMFAAVCRMIDGLRTCPEGCQWGCRYDEVIMILQSDERDDARHCVAWWICGRKEGSRRDA
jgi:hypothetical protein